MIRRSFCVSLMVAVMVALLAAGMASAAFTWPWGGKKKGPRGAPGDPVDVVLDGGLRVEFKGAFLYWPMPDPFARFLHSYFIVTPERDMILELDGGDALDTDGRRYKAMVHDDLVFSIGRRSGRKRKIPGGVPTVVDFRHKNHFYTDTEYWQLKNEPEPQATFEWMSFTFNGQELVFHNVEMQGQAAWEDLNEVYRVYPYEGIPGLGDLQLDLQ